MKQAAKRYAKAVAGAVVSGIGSAVAVAVAGPGADGWQPYATGVLVAFLTGTAVALKANTA